jgi:hypothetical protein
MHWNLLPPAMVTYGQQDALSYLTGILARTPLAVPLTGRARVPWRLPRREHPGYRRRHIVDLPGLAAHQAGVECVQPLLLPGVASTLVDRLGAALAELAQASGDGRILAAIDRRGSERGD